MTDEPNTRSTPAEGPVPQVREALEREAAFVRDMMDIERAEGQKQSTWQLLRDLADRLERLAALTARPSDEPARVTEMKLVYIKRWRTIVPLPATYADEIVEALRVTPSTVGMEADLADALGWLLDAIKSEGVVPTPLLKSRFTSAEKALLALQSHTIASEKATACDQTKENK